MQSLKRMKSLMLSLLIAIGFAFPVLTPRILASSGRDISIYTIKASDSSSSWIGNVDKVQEGIAAAVNDAITKTSVKFAAENIHLYTVTSSYDLYQLALNPPQHAVFINTHGEVVPIPEAYAQNDAGSGGDAGDSSGSAASVSAYTTYTGFLADSDTNDWYKIYLPAVNYNLSVSMTPPSDSDFDLELYDPSGAWRKGSYQGGNATDSVWCTTESMSGYWRVRIYISSGLGDYAFILRKPPADEGGGGCPFVSVWNGDHYLLDNNVLPRAELSDGADVEDYYKSEQPLVLKDGRYSLLLSEFEKEYSYFDQVKLLAVDHKSDVNIAVTPDGEILTYKNPAAPISAIDNHGSNKLNEISLMDGNVSDPTTYFFGDPGDYLILNFGHVHSQNAKLIVREDMKKQFECIDVQVKDRYGAWKTIDVLVPREYWSFEAVDLSNYVVANQDLLVRLYWKYRHKVDYVGLDTSSQANIKVREAKLLSAIHSKTLEDVKTKLTYSDKEYATLLPGQQIELQFALLKDPEDDRDFLFVSKGHYNRLTSSPAASPAEPDPPVPKWRYWFDLIAKNCREKGWIWTNVVGYPLYYVSNVNKFGLVTVGENGLKRYLGRDVTLNYYEGNIAEKGYDFDKEGFINTYTSLPENVKVCRTFNADTDLPWDALGYVDTADGSHATFAITMNTTIMGTQTLPGFFIHNGLSTDVNGDGVVNDQDDWLKGYITAAMAIEEARALISWPIVLTESFGNVHTAAFTVSMRPGDYGKSWDANGHYGYVRLELSVGAQYDSYYPFPYTYLYFLTQVDFDISGNSNTHFEVDVAKSGINTGDKDTALMNDLYWWNIGTLAGAIPSVGTVLGPAIGLIPIIIDYFEAPNHNYTIGNHVWAKEISFDPNSDDRGTAAMFVEIRFYGIEGQGDTDYTFNVNMVSWIGYMTLTGFFWPRLDDISFNTQLTFTIRWNMI